MGTCMGCNTERSSFFTRVPAARLPPLPRGSPPQGAAYLSSSASLVTLPFVVNRNWPCGKGRPQQSKKVPAGAPTPAGFHINTLWSYHSMHSSLLPNRAVGWHAIFLRIFQGGESCGITSGHPHGDGDGRHGWPRRPRLLSHTLPPPRSRPGCTRRQP